MVAGEDACSVEVRRSEEADDVGGPCEEGLSPSVAGRFEEGVSSCGCESVGMVPTLVTV